MIRRHLDLLIFSSVDEEIVDASAPPGKNAAELPVTGGYRFRTIKPVAYPGRAPHIHFAITVDGQAPLVTQMYVAGAAENAGDGLLQRVRDPLARAALIVAFEQTPGGGELLARFDIVLGAAGQGGG